MFKADISAVVKVKAFTEWSVRNNIHNCLWILYEGLFLSNVRTLTDVSGMVCRYHGLIDVIKLAFLVLTMNPVLLYNNPQKCRHKSTLLAPFLVRRSYTLAVPLMRSAIWKQANKSTVTPNDPTYLPHLGSNRKQMISSQRGQGSVHVVVSEQTNCWHVLFVWACVWENRILHVWWYSVMRGKNNSGTDCKQRQVSC